MKKYFNLLLIFVFVSIVGCQSFTIAVEESTPVTDGEKKTIHALFWGLFNDPQEVLASDCLSKSMHEVKYSTNTVYLLITFITLGFWMPIDVEWRCGPRIELEKAFKAD